MYEIPGKEGTMRRRRLRVACLVLLLLCSLVLFAVARPKGIPAEPAFQTEDCITSGPYCEWPENECWIYIYPIWWEGSMQTCKVDLYCPEKMTVGCTPPDGCPCRVY